MWQPEPGRWSIAGYLDHLHLTAVQYQPRVEKALTHPARAPGPFVYKGAFRNWVNRNTDNPDRLRIKTAPAYVPVAGKPVDALLKDYWQSHQQMESWIRRADGLDLANIPCPHPHPLLAILLPWSLGQAIYQLLAHERRHLTQAERLRNLSTFPPA